MLLPPFVCLYHHVNSLNPVFMVWSGEMIYPLEVDEVELSVIGLGTYSAYSFK